MDQRDAQRDLTARRRRGLLLGVVLLLVAAYPVLGLAGLAHSSYSGCWLACGGTPNTTVGTAWVIVAASVLATPIAVALRVARVRSRLVWALVALVVVLAALGWVAFSLDPAHAAFFVELGE